MLEDPVLVVPGEDGESLMEKLLGRQVLGLAFVPETSAAMIQFDGGTCVYFRVKDDALMMEIEAPTFQ